MKKIKIVAVLCLAFVMFSQFSFSPSAKEVNVSSFSEKLELLSALGIMDEAIVSPDDAFTRANFAKVIAYLSGLEVNDTSVFDKFTDVNSNHAAAKQIATAVSLGFMQGVNNSEFAPDKPISYIDTIKALVRLAGYPVQVQDETKYLITGASCGITKGISKLENSAVSVSEMCDILYNMTKVKICEAISYSDTVEYKKSKTETVLSKNLAIYKAEGIIDATYLSSLASTDNTGKNRVRIGGYVYKINTPKYSEYLGRNVEYYYCDSEEEGLLLLYAALNGSEDDVTITSEQILSGGRSLKYEQDGKEKTVKIPSGVNVIYNGSAVSSYNDSIFNPDDGSISLFDNDKDGQYDTVNIVNYESFAVSNIYASEEMIYGKFGESIKLGDKTKIFTAEGNQISISGVKPGSVASVLKTYEGEALTVIISENTVTGKIMQMDIEDKTYVTIGASKFVMASSLAKDTGLDIKPGFFGVFSLGINGRIYDAESTKKTKFAYLVKAAASSDIAEDVSIKLFETDGKMHVYQGIKKLKVNGVNVKGGTDIMSAIGGDGQVTVIGFDDNGNLESIETAYNYPATSQFPDTDNTVDSDRLRIIYSNYWNPQSISKTTYKGTVGAFGGRVYLTGSTVYFDVPDAPATATDDEYEVYEGPSSRFSNDHSYSIEGYCTKKDNFTTDCIVSYHTAGAKAYSYAEGESPADVVKNISYALNSDREPAVKITVTDWRSESSYILKNTIDVTKIPHMSDASKSSELRVGDVIHYVLDNNNEICKIETMCRVGDAKGEFTADVQQGYTGGTRVVKAGIYDCNTDYIKISTNAEITGELGRDAYEVHSLARPEIQMYNSETGKVTYGGPDKLIAWKDSATDYSKIFMYTYAAIPYLIVIYD